MEQVHYLTKERLEELKTELNDLKMRVRAEIADRLKRAKEMGDLSENAEYSEAKDEQARIEGRIGELEDVIKTAKLIAKSAPTGKVQIGSTIEVEKNNQKFKFTIVGSTETNPEGGLISNESPLGKAFFNRKVGDEVRIKVPSGEVVYKILKID